jgi:hypothetical protein
MKPARRISRPPDLDRLGGAGFLLGQRQLEHAVLQLRDDTRGVDLVRQREAARRAAVVGADLADDEVVGALDPARP